MITLCTSYAIQESRSYRPCLIVLVRVNMCAALYGVDDLDGARTALRLWDRKIRQSVVSVALHLKHAPETIFFTRNKNNSRQRQFLWPEHAPQGCVYDVLGGRQHADPSPASTATSVDNECESWWCHSSMSLMSLTTRVVPKNTSKS
jgi:hypothetical protein